MGGDWPGSLPLPLMGCAPHMQGRSRPPLRSLRFRIPLRLHLPAPLFRVLVVQSFHCLGSVGVFFHYVGRRGLHHLIPGVCRQSLVAGSAELPTSHGFHCARLSCLLTLKRPPSCRSVISTLSARAVLASEVATR